MNRLTTSLHNAVDLVIAWLIVVLEPDVPADDAPTADCRDYKEREGYLSPTDIPLDAPPLLEEYPLPRCFEDWWWNEARKGK